MAKDTQNTVPANNMEAEMIDGKQVVTQDQFLDMKIDEAVKARMLLMSVNKIELGCAIGEKKVRQGGIKNAETGERWPDSYNVEVVFEGGRFPVRVDETQFHLLRDDGTRYIAKGRLASKVNENGFSMPDVKITSIENF